MVAASAVRLRRFSPQPLPPASRGKSQDVVGPAERYNPSSLPQVLPFQMDTKGVQEALWPDARSHLSWLFSTCSSCTLSASQMSEPLTLCLRLILSTLGGNSSRPVLFVILSFPSLTKAHDHSWRTKCSFVASPPGCLFTRDQHVRLPAQDWISKENGNALKSLILDWLEQIPGDWYLFASGC